MKIKIVHVLKGFGLIGFLAVVYVACIFAWKAFFHVMRVDDCSCKDKGSCHYDASR